MKKIASERNAYAQRLTACGQTVLDTLPHTDFILFGCILNQRQSQINFTFTHYSKITDEEAVMGGELLDSGAPVHGKIMVNFSDGSTISIGAKGKPIPSGPQSFRQRSGADWLPSPRLSPNNFSRNS